MEDNDIVLIDNVQDESIENHISKKVVKRKRRPKLDFKKVFPKDLMLLISTILVCSITLIMLHGFIISLIGSVEDVNYVIDGTVEDIVLDNSIDTKTFAGKLKIYRELNSVNGWDFEKYSKPVLEKISKVNKEPCNNYHLEVLSVPFTIDYTADYRIRINLDIDNDVAVGTMKITRNYLDEDGKIIGDVEYVFDICRVMKDGNVVTYMSKDGEHWFAKNGIEFFEDSVALDVNKIVEEACSRELTWFPTRYEGNISMSMNTHPFYDPLPQFDALYESFSCLRETNYLFDEETYKLTRVAGGLGSEVNETKMKDNFVEINDPVLNTICQEDLRLSNVYSFSDYGDVSVSLPDNLDSAVNVDDFSELIIEACPELLEGIYE